MGVKLSGLMSNMDTDSIVEQLMAAQRTKVTKIENKKTKLTWSQEKWKDLNTKIYKLYTDQLSKLRLQNSFSTFQSTSSNESAVSVTASSNAPVGSQSISVTQLASSQIITGKEIGDGKLKASSSLVSDLKIAEGTVFTILSGTESNPKKLINYTVTANSTMADFTKACQDAGLNASFDATNKRFYISSKNSGEENAFSITASNGVLSQNAQSARQAVYDKFTNVIDKDGDPSIVELPIKLKSQIDTYLNNYTFSTSDKEKESIVENIYNLRANYLKGLIQQEAANATDSQKLTSEEINQIYAERYESDENKEAVLSNIKSQAELYSSGFTLSQDDTALKALGIHKDDAHIIKAQNSKISVNDVDYEQASNSITINGLTINAKQVTSENVTVSVTKDNQAAYDMVKNFIKEYNSILKEMNTLYYADSSRGYDPLTDDEKEAMSDDQIEKWETKIKDSLLRRDSTLGALTTAMKSAMSGSIAVTTKTGDVKNYSLSTFGITTSSDYTEKGLLHIYGDADDSTYATQTDKLMAALEDDPDAVMQTITGIAKNLYSTLTDKMKSTSLSSALTFYNDKQMDKQQTQYAKDIKELEARLEDMENSYYKKFSAMETALAKLQQNTSALSSLMGNS